VTLPAAIYGITGWSLTAMRTSPSSGRAPTSETGAGDRELARRRDVEPSSCTPASTTIRNVGSVFEELWIPAPDYHRRRRIGLACASRPAAVMQRFEPILTELRPDLVLV